MNVKDKKTDFNGLYNNFYWLKGSNKDISIMHKINADSQQRLQLQ